MKSAESIELSDNARDLVNEMLTVEKKGVYLSGPTGTYKTTAARLLAKVDYFEFNEGSELLVFSTLCLSTGRLKCSTKSFTKCLSIC